MVNLDSHQFLQWRVMNFWVRNAAPRDFLRKPSASFSVDSHNKVRKAIYLGKLYSLSFYSFSLQDLLKGFIWVLLHFHSLDYPLKMVVKACSKMATKTEILKQNGYFWGKRVMRLECNNFPPTPYSFLWGKVLYFQYIENFLERT